MVFLDKRFLTRISPLHKKKVNFFYRYYKARVVFLMAIATILGSTIFWKKINN
jgi:hypothetical protein